MARDKRNADQKPGLSRRTVLGASGAVAGAAFTGGVWAAALAQSSSQGQEAFMQDDVITVAVMIFDGVTQLDATAPLEVFAAAGLHVVTVAPQRQLIQSGSGLRLMPDHDYDSAPRADILCVPGGPGVNRLLNDDATMAYLAKAAHEARYVTSVCTGALLLGAAGLLVGKRATTHWASHHFLDAFGAIAVNERVVTDGNTITGGGVTAGVDFAFAILDHIRGREAAALTMLALEYDPAPPFEGGAPDKVDPEILSIYQGYAQGPLEERASQVARAAARL